MRNDVKSSKSGDNSTRTATSIQPFRCTVSGQHPIYTSYKVDVSDVLWHSDMYAALGHFIEDCRKKYPQYEIRLGSITVNPVFPVSVCPPVKASKKK